LVSSRRSALARRKSSLRHAAPDRAPPFPSTVNSDPFGVVTPGDLRRTQALPGLHEFSRFLKLVLISATPSCHTHRVHGWDNPRTSRCRRTSQASHPTSSSPCAGLWMLRLIVSRQPRALLRPRRRWLNGSSGWRMRASGTRTSSSRRRWPKAWCLRCSEVAAIARAGRREPLRRSLAHFACAYAVAACSRCPRPHGSSRTKTPS